MAIIVVLKIAARMHKSVDSVSRHHPVCSMTTWYYVNLCFYLYSSLSACSVWTDYTSSKIFHRCHSCCVLTVHLLTNKNKFSVKINWFMFLLYFSFFSWVNQFFIFLCVFLSFFPQLYLTSVLSKFYCIRGGSQLPPIIVSLLYIQNSLYVY